jgi:dolichol-phosphate mannosyltransferase
MESKLLSIILLAYYSEHRVKNVYEKVVSVFEKENIQFELIIIDDGSKDNTYKIASELEQIDNRVKAYQLSRNFTSPYAKIAGFSKSHGACVTSMPDDFQLPLDLYVTMYREWEKGTKLIIPCRKSRSDGPVKDFFSNSYYKLMNSLSIVKFPKGGFDAFLADREIIDILVNNIHPINTSCTVEVLRLGFDPVFIPFSRPHTTGKSRWTFRKKIKLAADTFYTSSNFPIKFITFLGFITFFLSLILIVLTVVGKLLGERSLGGFSIPGWASIFIFISLFSGLILFSLGIIAEYIWRIYEEVKNRPGYIIKKKEKH